jgi:hypothetical protein
MVASSLLHAISSQTLKEPRRFAATRESQGLRFGIEARKHTDYRGNPVMDAPK